MPEEASVEELVEQQRNHLPPAERRVAEVVLRTPEAVAFGTVARVAELAGTSGASVVRFATRLGFPGFSSLQAAVQRAIGQQLRPAVGRIRAGPGPGGVAASLAVEGGNGGGTVAAVGPGLVGAGVGLLGTRPRVLVMAGEAEAGVGAMLAGGL